MLKRQKDRKRIKLKNTLILNRFILNLFGASSFSAIAKEMKEERLEGYDENNISHFYHQLIGRMFANGNLPKDQLLEYDQNIFRHSRQIMEKQNKDFKWKYFQYLSLLFTEIYLDRYFSDPNGLQVALTSFGTREEIEESSGRSFSYAISDLNKIAYWSATGSGKTLIMHVNILQYLFYAEKHNKIKDLNRIILLTPNEGLSMQHENELLKSGFHAELFRKQQTGLFSGTIIEIIDIHKLEEKEGEKTVALESFEKNNLVLVDEGHRGASGDDWKVKRDALSEEGFSFEYSATFGQAVSAANGGKREALLEEYSKCTIFDYSYKYFYDDGYGKDYHILNLNETWNQQTIDVYLTASMLSFYQQMLAYYEHSSTLIKFNLEKPLLIFVGSSVTAVRTEKGNQVSDVINILRFLQRFVKDSENVIDTINRVLHGKAGLIDAQHRPLFRNTFPYLVQQKLDGEKCYYDILRRIFNTGISGAELHLDNLRGAEGEIGMRVGDSPYFGVINVGDDAKLLKLCEDNGIITSQKDFSDSLFRSINDKDTELTMLIGSKKFTEGWNSWRVSTMGLMNVGRGEGTEIIQLFGRGVRLKGYNFSLKRSSRLDHFHKPENIPEYLRYLETLNVFGIRADYMQQFKEYLEDEGLNPNETSYEEISIPVLPAVELIDNKKLKILKVKDGVEFKKDIQFELEDLTDQFHGSVTVDWYPKIQVLNKNAEKRTDKDDSRERDKLNELHRAFVNWDKVYFEILNFKNERGWNNMSIKKETLIKVMEKNAWYTLYIPGHELQPKNVEQIHLWQEIIVALLKAYCDKVYNYIKNSYLSEHLVYQELDIDHPNFITEYTLLIEKTEQQLIGRIKELKEALNDKKIAGEVRFEKMANFTVIDFSQHLYKPLIHISKGAYRDILTITPMHLVESEKRFLDDLKKFYSSGKEYFKDKELYLLRNLSRRGVGFFEANNFYPDFIMWIIHEGKQYVNFIDPKGLRQIRGFNSSKIAFHTLLKEKIQKKLNTPDVELNSFILSSTPLNELDFWQGGQTYDDFEKHNVFFLDRGASEYLPKLIEKAITVNGENNGN